ncbi:MAG: hypothetical protein H6824_10260 [Planctomycetaceae bacterium]|nr:hypothetical protein [Planctomycetaceae bacterium]
MRLVWQICFAAMLLTTVGCTNLMTKQAIERFSAGLQEQNLEQLRENTSTAFAEQALRIPGSQKDLKRLHIPTDKFKVESVEQIDATHRIATVKYGEGQREQTLEYQLTKDADSGHWVVDDLIIAPDPTGENPPSIAEQMNLMLTIREFLASWYGEDREAQLAYCHPEFRETLEALPPAWLDKLIAQTVGNGRQRAIRPEPRVNGNNAAVALPHPDGMLLLELKRGSTWMVSDAAVQVKGQDGTEVPSVHALAHTLLQASEFLAAYGASDRNRLKELSTDDFYEKCLVGADLSAVPLPVAEILLSDFDPKIYKERRELLFDVHGTAYMVTLEDVETEETLRGNSEKQLKVSEVTIFEADGSEVKRLSAMFLSHAVVQMFGEALQRRDVSEMKKMSSLDFNSRVWSRETAKLFAAMPLPEVESGHVHVIATVFHGDTTEVTVTQGTRGASYVLTLEDNRVVVDDIMFPSSHRPTSFKKNLEVLLPMYAFVSALHRRSIPELLTNSGEGLDSMVWRQVEEVPQLEFDLLPALMQPVTAIEVGRPWTIVRMGDSKSGTEVRLVQEGDRYVVHDVESWKDDAVAGRYNLLQSLRQRLASGEIAIKKRSMRSVIMPAGGTTAAASDEGVETAIYSESVPSLE